MLGERQRLAESPGGCFVAALLLKDVTERVERAYAGTQAAAARLCGAPRDRDGAAAGALGGAQTGRCLVRDSVAQQRRQPRHRGAGL